MDAIYEELCAIAADAAARSVPLVTIGAFAVRAYLARPDARLTNDIDVLTPRERLDDLRGVLEARGYRFYSTGPWWRAEREDAGERRVVDVASGAVVDVGSFESYPLDVKEACMRAEAGGVPLPVPMLEDVIALKLLAHRDKDLIDLVLLARDAGGSIDDARFEAHVESRDLEVPIQRGYLELVAAADSGELARLWERRSAEALTAATLAAAVARLHTLVR